MPARSKPAATAWRCFVEIGLGAFVVSALVASPAPAEACGACVCDASPNFGPGLVRAGAPLNIRIFLPPSRLEDLRLTAGGVLVPIDLEPAGDAVGSMWMTPREPLEPFTEYTLRGGWGYDTFVTGDARDITPPTITRVAMGGELGSRGGMCGVTVGGGLSVSGYADDTAIGSWAPAQIDLETGGTVRRVFLPLAAVTNDQQVPFGRLVDETGAGQCFGPAWFPEVEEGRTYRATVTFHDWAGNSTVVDWLELHATRELPGGCNAFPPGPSADGGAAARGGADPGGGGGCSVATRRSPPVAGGLSIGAAAILSLAARRRRRRAR